MGGLRPVVKVSPLYRAGVQIRCLALEVVVEVRAEVKVKVQVSQKMPGG